MCRLTLSDLPEVFVPFSTFRSSKGKIVFYNKKLKPNLGKDELLERYSYITLGTGVDSDIATDKKYFLLSVMVGTVC